MQIASRFTCLFLALVLSFGLSGFATLADENPQTPAPDPEALQKARKLVKEVYESDFERAKSSSIKEQLAKKLFDHAKLTDNDSASRYALLEQVRSLAIEAGSVKLALGAVSELGQFAGFKQFESQLDVLTQLSTGNRTRAQASPSESSFATPSTGRSKWPTLKNT